MDFIKDKPAQKAIMFAIIISAIIMLMMPQAAKAQSAMDILSSIGRVTGATPYGCGYGDAVVRANCYARHVQSKNRSRESRSRQNAQATVDKINKQARIQAALGRACEAGDRQSCVRKQQMGQTVSAHTKELAQALLSACYAGDKQSCDRLGG